MLVSSFPRYRRFVALHAISPPHDRPGRTCMNGFAWTWLFRGYCNIHPGKIKTTTKNKTLQKKRRTIDSDLNLKLLCT